MQSCQNIFRLLHGSIYKGNGMNNIPDKETVLFTLKDIFLMLRFQYETFPKSSKYLNAPVLFSLITSEIFQLIHQLGISL